VTVAVCIRCGARKIGAFTSCPGCGFAPVEGGDQAKSLILSDHHLPEDQLDEIAARIQGGLPVTYPEDTVQQLTEELEAMPPVRMPCLLELGCVGSIAGVLALVAWAAIRGC